MFLSATQVGSKLLGQPTHLSFISSGGRASFWIFIEYLLNRRMQLAGEPLPHRFRCAFSVHLHCGQVVVKS